MIWKIASIGLILWFIQSYFHFPVAMAVLLGIAGVMAVVAQFIMTSHRLVEPSRKI
jgi:phosphate starvation-inducible membrane PsiE